MTTQTVQVKKVPRALWQRLGVHAATHGMTKREVLIRALSAYLLHNGESASAGGA